MIYLFYPVVIIFRQLHVFTDRLRIKKYISIIIYHGAL